MSPRFHSLNSHFLLHAFSLHKFYKNTESLDYEQTEIILYSVLLDHFEMDSAFMLIM